MPRGVKTLAVALVALAQAGEQTENISAGILKAIAVRKLHTVEDFDAAILEAYTQNGWHVTAGRPTAEATAERRAVPHTVRNYVWEIRSAYKAGVKVWTYPSLNALRMARRKKREAGAAPSVAVISEGVPHVPAVIPPEVVEDFDGVKVAAVTKVNGALFHDLMVCFLHLPTPERSAFGRELARLLHKYQPRLPAPAAAPAPANEQPVVRRRRAPAQVEVRA